MDAASRSGKTGQDTMEIGATTRLMDKVHSGTSMAISIKASGSMIKHMDMEPTAMQMEQNTKVTGTKTSSKATELKSGLMALSMRAITFKAASTEKASTPGRMGLNMMAIGLIIRSMAEEPTSG